MNKSNLQVITSPLFVCSLALLLINDFFLKSLFHNWLTGKLSDFAGLFVFSIFWTAFFPKRKLLIFLLTGIGFVFWKSQFSQGFIDFFNSYAPFAINRVVDFSDLIALSVLPFAWFYVDFKHNREFLLRNKFANRATITAMAFISLFAFTATSHVDDRRIFFENAYTFNGSKEDFDERLKQLERVSDLKIVSQEDAYKNLPDVKINPDGYSYTFLLEQKHCDSNYIIVRAMAVVRKDSVALGLISTRFWCKEEPTKATEQEIIEIIERDIIQKLQMTEISFEEWKERISKRE